MHGVIFSELKKFTDARLGPESWTRLLRQTGLSSRVYLPTKAYPDEEIQRIMAAAASAAGVSVRDVMEELGTFIVPDLLRLYGALVDPKWRTLDLIEHTESMIHRVVRLNDGNARPPELLVTRAAPNRAVIVYRSSRRMCGVARGIVRGVAAHYGEAVEVTEPSCMLEGASECTIEVTTPAS